MQSPFGYSSRRGFLAFSGRTFAAIAGGSVLAPAAWAELVATPAFTEGPFYPNKLPLDTDNDLLILNESTNHAIGEITHLTGQVLRKSGEPLRNAVVEIWQCDSNGAYLHTGTNNADSRDKNFQGYGRFLTDSKGAYYFRTIKPVPYPGRTPHIHFAISQNGQRVLTTQMFVKGHPQNERDGVFRSAGEGAALETVQADFTPLPDSKLGELTANFDIVLGRTAAEGDDGKFPGIVAKSQGDFGGPGGRRGRRPPR